jgi:putative Holliday junction resolvase
MGGVLAIDYGEKKSGFAAADALRISVRPLEVFRTSEKGGEEELMAHVAALLEERDVSTLLVGLPLSMDGSESERTQATRAFSDRLQRRFPEQRTVLHDERLSTKEAESLLHEEGYRGKEIRERKDSWSALVTLRDWIAQGEPH